LYLRHIVVFCAASQGALACEWDLAVTRGGRSAQPQIPAR